MSQEEEGSKKITVLMAHPDWWKDYYYSTGSGGKAALGKYFAEVAFSFIRKRKTSEHSTRWCPIDSEDYSHAWRDGYLVTKRSADAIDRLSREIQLALERAWEKGRDYGQSLLLQLNSGELSMSDFDEAMKPKRSGP